MYTTCIRRYLAPVAQRHWLRRFALSAGVLFLLSWVFPVGAGLAKDTSAFPKWWAFVLAIAAFGIQALVYRAVDERAGRATYRIYRCLTHGLMAVGVLVIVAGDRISWVNCATGFLWRSWLALYILPWWLVALRSEGVSGA